MALFNWFKKNKKDKKVKVEEQKQAMFRDSAAAAAFAEAGEHETARAMIDKSKGNRNILVVASGVCFSEELFCYSVDMAKRLDFELLMLNVSDKEEARFLDKCQQNFTPLQERAQKAGVSMSQMVQCAADSVTIPVFDLSCFQSTAA